MRRFIGLGLILCACGTTAPDAGDAGDASIDVGDDGYNGAPSTVYPAPHPPLPTLVNAAGGPVLAAPKVELVFYPNEALEPALQSFAKAMAGSSYWTTTTSEYGVGALTYAGTIDLTDTPPKTIGQTDIQSWVASELASGAFGVPDPQTIYTIVYPQTTTITQPNPVAPAFGTVNSCDAFYGYHDNTQATIGDAGATSFAYAVIPTCGPVASLTETLSHEWVEASTDPELTSSGTFTLTGGPNAAFYAPDGDHAVWALLGGGEAGDLCEPEGDWAYFAPPELQHSVQRTWSNASAAASHDPCVPTRGVAFFDSAPVLDDTVTFTSGFTGPVTSKGVVIPNGQSKTIEVDLFSDGDTGGPWTVDAYDVLSTYYGSYGLPETLGFAWDRTSGQNGEKLHLTITVTKPSVLGGAHAFMIVSKLAGRTSVWPGLVVEQ
ncbi:MAG TPA: hypothetical protein VGH28_16750 [Polyangiaceae bacterium]|jgi:hypothetical protein